MNVIVRMLYFMDAILYTKPVIAQSLDFSLLRLPAMRWKENAATLPD